MDLELIPMALGIGIGALFGARGKDAMKSVAKGYFALIEQARRWTASAREDLRDAIEEAKYERAHESESSRASSNGRTGSTEKSEAKTETKPRAARKRTTTADGAKPTRSTNRRNKSETDEPAEHRKAA